MSFGYGISVSLIQMARAYTVFANDGVMLPISLYKTATPMPGKRVLAEKTAHEMRDLLIANSQPGGGAVGGRIIGYSIGGKSGTARKLEGRTYVANKHRALFMGFAPGKSPRVIVSVMIDEPSAGKYYGGAVAAPVFSQIAGGALRVLNVQPDEPSNNTLLPESTPVPVDFDQIMKSRLTPLPDWNPDDIKQLGLPVKRVETDSRRVLPGDVFLACPGLHSDGRDYIQAALAKGAAAVLWDDADGFAWNPLWQAPNLAVPNLRERIGMLAAEVYGHPSRALRVIGITGTNGKTSISHWLAQASRCWARRRR